MNTVQEPDPETVDDQPDSDRGYCRNFVQLCRGFPALMEDEGLSPNERYALLYLAGIADYKTATIAATWGDVAEILAFGKTTTKKILDSLRDRRLIRFYFPRGHRGWIAVDAYLDLVRVPPKRADEIEAHLATLSEPERPATPVCNGADPTSEDVHSANSRRWHRHNPTERTPASHPQLPTERTGKTPVSVPPDDQSSLLLSPTEPQGSQTPETTSAGSREAKRLGHGKLSNDEDLEDESRHRKTIDRCDRCGRPPDLHAYWGPSLCHECAQALAAEFDEARSWPADPLDESRPGTDPHGMGDPHEPF